MMDIIMIRGQVRTKNISKWANQHNYNHSRRVVIEIAPNNHHSWTGLLSKEAMLEGTCESPPEAAAAGGGGAVGGTSHVPNVAFACPWMTH